MRSRETSQADDRSRHPHATRGVSVIDADALAIGAANMMRARKIRHLPVVDREDRLIGIGTGVLGKPYRWAFTYR